MDRNLTKYNIVKDNRKKYPHLKLWKKTSNYAGDNLSDYYVILSKYRDSDEYDKIKYDKLLKQLGGTQKDKDGNYIVFEAIFSHWSSGIIYTILVRYDAPKKILHKAEKAITK